MPNCRVLQSNLWWGTLVRTLKFLHQAACFVPAALSLPCFERSKPKISPLNKLRSGNLQADFWNPDAAPAHINPYFPQGTCTGHAEFGGGQTKNGVSIHLKAHLRDRPLKADPTMADKVTMSVQWYMMAWSARAGS